VEATLKAKELFDKYFSEMRMPSDCEGCMQCVDRCGNMVAIAKKCSLIAVDEIFEHIDYIFTELEKDNLPNKFDDEIEYWQEVKKEIELL